MRKRVCGCFRVIMAYSHPQYVSNHSAAVELLGRVSRDNRAVLLLLLLHRERERETCFPFPSLHVPSFTVSTLSLCLFLYWLTITVCTPFQFADFLQQFLAAGGSRTILPALLQHPNR